MRDLACAILILGILWGLGLYLEFERRQIMVHNLGGTLPEEPFDGGFGLTFDPALDNPRPAEYRVAGSR